MGTLCRLHRSFGRVACLSVSMLLGACNTAPTRDPDFADVRPSAVEPLPPAGGAIYQANFNLVLFEDLRARRVGDVLTITLDEQTNATKSAETTITKQTSTSVSNPTLLGSPVQFSVPSFLPLLNTSDNNLETSLESNSDFEGTGESSQSNRLSGEITVTVAEVLPNGDLVVQGEKLTGLNQGYEHVRLSGRVRQADIRADNTVSSRKVANARIEYGGQDGAVADSNVLGWLARFFISAFFPF